MDDFVKFRNKVEVKIAEMAKKPLFRVNLTGDELFEIYLGAFESGTDPIFKERTEHNCNTCKRFIRDLGNVVCVNDDLSLSSIWEVDAPGIYAPVTLALAKKVKSGIIENVFLTSELVIGQKSNFSVSTMSVDTITFSHFYYNFNRDSRFYVKPVDKDSELGKRRTNFQTTKRALNELTLAAAETVIELIDNNLYRGAEHKKNVNAFLKTKKQFNQVAADRQDTFCWTVANDPVVAHIRNSAIGTLLIDLSEGMDVNDAVTKYEKVVAPANYKRPTAIITAAMKNKAEEKVKELGLEESLFRRFAVTDDLTVNNVLFVDRSIPLRGNTSPFDDLKVKDKIPQLDRIEEVPIDKFITDILPRVDKVEVMLENKHIPNLMSLIAPTNSSAPSLFQWNNGFSWTYNGDLTDSIKEKVKRAGGNVNGALRISLAWYNYDDLDLHVWEPNRNHIYFGVKRIEQASSGTLDVDMNAGSGTTREPVENIVWTNENRMPSGKYRVEVNQYRRQETKDVGFELEMQYGEVRYNWSYDKAVTGTVEVVTFNFDRKNGISIVSSLPHADISKSIWGLDTQQYVPVSMIMKSPNHWDSEQYGNHHLFFMLKGCINPDTPRGFFNEYLRPDLNEHRKVFEILGNKLRVSSSKDQLSGLGFSSTVKNTVVCRLTGSFSRTIKLLF